MQEQEQKHQNEKKGDALHKKIFQLTLSSVLIYFQFLL